MQAKALFSQGKGLGSKEYQDKAETGGEHDTPRKSLLSAAISDPHKRASRILGLALNINTLAGWNGVVGVWGVRLTDDERANVARAALQTLEPAAAHAVIEQVHGGAGTPLPPLLNPLSDAQDWADYASTAELKAYCLASFMAMTPKDKRDFLAFVQKGKP